MLGIGGTGVEIDDLIISGGVNALRGRAGSAFTGNNLVVEKASNANVLLNHSVVTLNTSTIQNSANDGIDAFWGSSVFLNGGTVQKNAALGVHAQFDGSADIHGGALLQNNGIAGAQATHGGVVNLISGSVTKSAFAAGGQGGVAVGTGGHLFVDGTATVSGNSVRGIGVFGGTAGLQDGAVVASNAGDGILLNPGHAKLRSGTIVRGNAGNGIDVESGAVTVGDGRRGGDHSKQQG